MTQVGGIASDQLKGIVERVEKLEEEKRAIGADIKDIFAEAKGNGFDVKAIRTILKMRKKSRDELIEEENIVDLYAHALGIDRGEGASVANSETDDEKEEDVA
jgi:uncharacterized protein (UPF0335 family)